MFESQEQIDAYIEAQNLKALINSIYRHQGKAHGSAFWVVGRWVAK